MAIYLLLVIAAVALAVGCSYIGVAIIVHLTNFYGPHSSSVSGSLPSVSPCLSSFDFDGLKHSVSDCDALITRLQQEVESRTKHRDTLDKTAFQFFLSQDNTNKDQLKTGYRHFQKTYDRTEESVGLVNRLIARIPALVYSKADRWPGHPTPHRPTKSNRKRPP